MRLRRTAICVWRYLTRLACRSHPATPHRKRSPRCRSPPPLYLLDSIGMSFAPCYTPWRESAGTAPVARCPLTPQQVRLRRTAICVWRYLTRLACRSHPATPHRKRSPLCRSPPPLYLLDSIGMSFAPCYTPWRESAGTAPAALCPLTPFPGEPRSGEQFGSIRTPHNNLDLRLQESFTLYDKWQRGT